MHAPTGHDGGGARWIHVDFVASTNVSNAVEVTVKMRTTGGLAGAQSTVRWQLSNLELF